MQWQQDEIIELNRMVQNALWALSYGEEISPARKSFCYAVKRIRSADPTSEST